MHTAQARAHNTSVGPRTTRATVALPAADESPSDERFHVLFSQGEIREVTLDQVDDFFRLGVIDEKTLLWAEGMDAWQTLGEAAGIGANEAAVAPSSGSRDTPEPPTRVAAPPPSRTVAVAPAPVRSVPAAPPHRSAPPPPLRGGSRAPAQAPARQQPVQAASAYPASSYVPAHVSTIQAPARSAPPSRTAAMPGAAAARTSRAPHANAFAAPAVPTFTPSTAPLSPPVMIAPSVAPQVRDVLESEMFGKPSGRWRRRFQVSLLCASVLAGAAVTLYRNDLLFTWAQSVKQGSAYLDFEKRWLGGAPEGTPRAVGALLGQDAAQPSDTSSSLLSAAVIPTPFGASEKRETETATGAQADAIAAAAQPEAAQPEVAAKAPAGAAPLARAEAPEKPVAAAEQAPAAAPVPVDSLPSVGGGQKYRGSSKSFAAAPRSRSADNDDSDDSRSSKREREREEAEESRSKAREKEKKAEPEKAVGPTDFLHASIRQAVDDAKSKKKGKKGKKKSGSSYDPLNGDI